MNVLVFLISWQKSFNCTYNIESVSNMILICNMKCQYQTKILLKRRNGLESTGKTHCNKFNSYVKIPCYLKSKKSFLRPLHEHSKLSLQISCMATVRRPLIDYWLRATVLRRSRNPRKCFPKRLSLRSHSWEISAYLFRIFTEIDQSFYNTNTSSSR